ncbi:MAG: 16S rRNA (guanine(527)-N(7))-methyltransferase RsmG [Usitatibacteraceae bacterium]
MLGAALLEMGLQLDGPIQEKLLRYVALLEKWNKVYNLTAIRGAERMVGMHLLDSLSVLPYILKARRVVDVGTGAGLPGIPLAIAVAGAEPGVRITMIDTVAKKTTFVRQAIGELELDNADVETARIEDYCPQEKFDVVISRAFAELKDFVDGAQHLCAENGAMLAMKGVHPFDEISRLPAGYLVDAVVPLTVPQVDGQRHLVIIKKTPPRD